MNRPDTPDDATPEGGVRLSRLEIWLVFLIAALLTLGIGLRGRLVLLQVNWDGLAAVAHAYDVFHAGGNANLAMIGFVQPPLPALLQLPLVLTVPSLATSGLAANVLGAVCAGVSAILLLGVAADCGLSGPVRWPLVTLFALHPLVLGPASCGAPMALLTTLLLGGAWGLLRWSRNESLRDLIASSVVLSGALITRYEAVFVVAGALIYLAWRTWRRHRSWNRLEGTLITFGLPIAYVAGIWIIANWAIMGDPWHFLRETFNAGGSGTVGTMLSMTLRLALLAFFPVLALMYNQMRGTGRRPASARPVAWMALTAMVAPALFPGVFARLGADGEWTSLVTVLAMVLAGGFAMLAAVLGDLIHRTPQRPPLHGTVLILLVSCGVAAWLYADGAAATLAPRQAYAGRGPLTASADTVIEAARRLHHADLPTGRRHLAVGWPGFAVVLLAGRTGEVEVIRTPDLPDYVDTVWAGSRLVALVSSEQGAVPPSLVEADLGLSPPLTLREQWTSGRWRCYQVVRETD